MAQDLVAKRQILARNAMLGVQELLDAYYKLIALQAERNKLGSDFTDSDFTGDLSHLTASMMGTLLDFVIGNGSNNDLVKWYADSGNGGRNGQILEQIKP